MNKLTTLCYIEKDNKYLMLHRIKKENDINHDKWIGVGGKFEWGESPEECMLREVWEETGLQITKIQGEDQTVSTKIGSVTTVSFEPYCVTQNLSGAYSIILNSFLCEAEGELLSRTDETENIGWKKRSDVERLLKEEPEKIFFMHVNALKKYLNL